RGAQPPDAQEGRLPQPRRPHQGAQEGRSQEGPQGAPVLEALSRKHPLMGRLFGTDGVRGLAGVDVTAELAMNLAHAAALVLGRSARSESRRAVAVVARDPRVSGEFIAAAVSAGLAAAGVDVLDAGVIPTPAAAYLVADTGADFGVMVSASHNPAPDNGIKFFAEGGRKLPDDVEDLIEAAMAQPPVAVTGHEVGRIRRFADAEDRYTMHLL